MNFAYFKKSCKNNELIGQIAIINSDFNPKGTIIINDDIYNAEAQEGFIEAGRGVKITRVIGKKIYIRRV